MKTAKLKKEARSKTKKKEGEKGGGNKTLFGEGFNDEEFNRYKEEETHQSGIAGVT